jgi:carbonic anhydrase
MSNKELLQQENSKIHQEVLDANLTYAESFGEKSSLALPPSRKFAILTCMDARLDPAKYAGLSEGDAHVIRNAGGRASDDAIRSLVISHKLLGTAEWFVIHHNDCGMEYFTDEIIRDLFSKSLATASVDENGWKNVTEEGGSNEAKHISFLTISNQTESIIDDPQSKLSHRIALIHKST